MSAKTFRQKILGISLVLLFVCFCFFGGEGVGLRAERNLSTGPVTHVDPLTMIRKGDQEGGEI